MIQLLMNLFERFGIFAMVFIFIMRFDSFKRLLTGKATRYEKLLLSFLFGVFGIAGTYMGVPVHNAIANSRVVGVALGGILGGPLVGLFAGFIAGSHRFLIGIGGFTAVACGVATVVEGFAGGVLYHKLKRKTFDPAAAFFAGVTVEVMQMLIILMLAKPFDAAFNLVKIIALPMIFVNSIGLALFVELISSVSKEQERVGAYQAQTALKIALRTLPFLRGGLNYNSASETTQIILQMTDLDAVAITDEYGILSHKGTEEDRHKPGGPLLTSATKKALASGNIEVPMTRHGIGCTNRNCRLGSAIIVPLKRWDKPLGALELYRLKEDGISALDMELANGLAHLFSNQLELAEVENQRKLVTDAEIRALQAQINPHFLFNAINTIISYIRINPGTASDLLVKLADFFRKNINPGTGNVPLAAELEHCKAYIAIEKARFEDRVKVQYDIDDKALPCKLPPLTLQPLVENALKHGILPKEDGGEIIIGAYRENGAMRVFVGDNGIGMPRPQLESLFSEKNPGIHPNGSGIALKNVNARLTVLYGTKHALHIESEPDKGTTVSFTVPQ
ncbi:MAG: sensor histidine kinase [Nitrospirae bacterium]|nr:sensor histidine kinase [Nitrospirota bacterium]MCL5236416.1 sensor histidine kinase [Nitrospirota bacterium]